MLMKGRWTASMLMKGRWTASMLLNRRGAAGMLSRGFVALAILLGGLGATPMALAANTCFTATTAAGTSGANDGVNTARLYQNLCWLDFTGLSLAAAQSAGGQNFR